MAAAAVRAVSIPIQLMGGHKVSLQTAALARSGLAAPAVRVVGAEAVTMVEAGA